MLILKYLAPHIASLLSPLGKRPNPEQSGDGNFINLCNRLAIANQVKTENKVYSSVRSDYMGGWEVDRFFRLTKALIKGAVLVGPEIISDFQTNSLFVSIEIAGQNQAGCSISNVWIKVCCGPNSFTSLGENYMRARKFLTAEEQKGVGEESMANKGIHAYTEPRGANMLASLLPPWPRGPLPVIPSLTAQLRSTAYSAEQPVGLSSLISQREGVITHDGF